MAKEVAIFLAIIGAGAAAGVAFFLGRHIHDRPQHQTGSPYIAFALFAAVPILVMLLPFISMYSLTVGGDEYSINAQLERLNQGTQEETNREAERVQNLNATARGTDPLPLIRSLDFSSLGNVVLKGENFENQQGSVSVQPIGLQTERTELSSESIDWQNREIRVRATSTDALKLEKLVGVVAAASQDLSSRLHRLEYSITSRGERSTRATLFVAIAFRVPGTAPLCGYSREDDPCGDFDGFSKVGTCREFGRLPECNNPCLRGYKIVCSRLITNQRVD